MIWIPQILRGWIVLALAGALSGGHWVDADQPLRSPALSIPLEPERSVAQTIVARHAGLEEVLRGFWAKKGGRGRARTRPGVVYGNAADDAQAIREGLRRQGIRAGIAVYSPKGESDPVRKADFDRPKSLS
jgi:hypothetical protein